MVYVARDGTVYPNRPWSVGKIIDCFWDVINFVFAFFSTLIPGGAGRPAIDSRNRGSGSGGGGGGPGGPSSGRPRRPIGRITTIQDCSMPGGG